MTEALPGRTMLTRSIERVAVPIPGLSQTEERIVLLVAQGRSRREIAAVVGLDARTVDWHLAQADRKLERAGALLDRVRARRQREKGAGE